MEIQHRKRRGEAVCLLCNSKMTFLKGGFRCPKDPKVRWMFEKSKKRK